MTIGIAATGTWAGAGILAGLRAVEAVGRGAIGGFVSFAALTEDQRLIRAETQNGGTGNLFNDNPPYEILIAPFAALISSGPDRPAPLSQFLAAAPGVGLVTGHRFPHVPVGHGQPINDMILQSMKSGLSPQSAIDTAIEDYASLDAGFIALAVDNEIGIGNMPLVLLRSDQGAAVSSGRDIGGKAATLHNAIHPHKPLAELSNEVVLHEMRQRMTQVRSISVAAGVKFHLGAQPEIHVDRNLQTVSIYHPNAETMDLMSSFGMGDRVKVIQAGEPLGWLGHEPFMVVNDGAVLSFDGKEQIELPVLVRQGSGHAL